MASTHRFLSCVRAGQDCPGRHLHCSPPRPAEGASHYRRLLKARAELKASAEAGEVAGQLADGLLKCIYERHPLARHGRRARLIRASFDALI
jgi:hypothetical protein